MLHKLRAGMVRPDRDTIGAPYPVEVDECCIGGRTRGEGRGTHHQTTVAGAVEVRTRKDVGERSASGVPAKKLTYAGRLRLRVVSSIEQTDPLSGRDIETLTAFVNYNVTRGSVVRTDGWQGYNDIAGIDERTVIAAVVQFHRGLWFTIFASSDQRIIEFFNKPEVLQLPASVMVRPGNLLGLLPEPAVLTA